MAEILAGKSGRDRLPRAGIEQVVADLRRVEGSAVDDLMQGGGLPQGGDAEVLRLPLGLQATKGLDDGPQHVLRAERPLGTGALVGDVVVELDQIHGIPPQPRQTCFHRADDGPAQVPHLSRWDLHLRPHVDIGSQFLQHLAQVALRLPIPIGWGRIEVVDACFHGSRHRAHAVFRLPADDQPADVPAAKAERRDAQSCLS